MKVVMIDADNLAGEGHFPNLNLRKFAWEQYLTVAPEDIDKAVWRCDVIVAASDTVDKAMLDKAFKLQLIVAAGDSTAHIDLEAAKERGIKVCHVPGRDPSNIEDDKKICREVVSAINAFIKESDYNRVA
jgi:lactate dehydrogenase-like 2-hydroxyacid dehydrogenase